MPTIKDVARQAGVSIGTVSNVLNNVPTVSTTIRRRVLKAMRELDYRPNRVARSLVSGRTQTIAFIIPDICNPFFPEMVRGAAGRAGKSGYSLFLGNADNDVKMEIDYIRHFISQGVDGLVLVTSAHSGPDSIVAEEIRNLDLPLSLVDREIEGVDRDLVIIDNVRCAETAVNHLLDSGRKRIGLITGPLETMTARQRLEGGRRALQTRGSFDEALVHSGAFTMESGFGIMTNLLKSGPRDVDAVFCANDMIAIGAMKAIEEEGRRVPEDIAVVGFDDLYLSSLIKPPLTAIRQPAHDLGTIAVSMTIERIEGIASGSSRKVILPGELMIRESTRKPEKR